MFSKLSGLETGSPIVVPTGLCPGFLSPARPDAISPALGGPEDTGLTFGFTRSVLVVSLSRYFFNCIPSDGIGGGGGPPFAGADPGLGGGGGGGAPFAISYWL